MPLLESHHQCPDCLSMELAAIPIASDVYELYLTLKFDEQWESLLTGRIKFGLKGGKLRLRLDNSEMTQVVEQLNPSCHIIPSNSPTDFTWLLTAQNREVVFQQSWEKIKLATVRVTQEPYQITTNFTIPPSAISITAIEGLWRHDISPNKHGVLERKIAIFLCKSKFHSDLCSIKLGSDLVNLAEKPPQENKTEALSELEQVIETVYQAKTHDFLELLTLANLNPLIDIAGANLLAAELSGIQLSGANLTNTNLRGANLTDADLSEADLSYAKLGGADLSGAYLENANLEYADLHRASLALANLIRANLKSANLRETNLSSTTLSGAQVSNAVFKNNIGISPETKLTLQQGGAIIT